VLKAERQVHLFVLAASSLSWADCLLARHPLPEPELLELLIIFLFADLNTAAEVGVRVPVLQLVTLGYTPPLRSAPISNLCDGQRSDQQCLTHPTVSSAANATNEIP
jgi:hypothetical protein